MLYETIIIIIIVLNVTTISKFCYHYHHHFTTIFTLIIIIIYCCIIISSSSSITTTTTTIIIMLNTAELHGLRAWESEASPGEELEESGRGLHWPVSDPLPFCHHRSKLRYTHIYYDILIYCTSWCRLFLCCAVD